MMSMALLLVCGELQAHDFWIEPSTFHPLPGTVVTVGLRVGQNFIGDAVPRYSDGIAQFFIRQNGTDEPIEGADGRDPAGLLRASGEATATIAYRSTGSPIVLAAAEFEAYLRQYGLDSVIAERAKRGESGKTGQEKFYRYAKALLAGAKSSPGGMPSPAVSQPLGFDYEIVPDDDPAARFAPLRGRVLYDGKPLAGALVVATPRDRPSAALRMRSNERGAFAFPLPHGGVWLITSVHMVRASFFSNEDWDSLWASLTFDMPPQ